MIDREIKVGDRIQSTTSQRIGQVLSIDLDKEFMDVVIKWDRCLENGPRIDTHSSRGLKLWAVLIE